MLDIVTDGLATVGEETFDERAKGRLVPVVRCAVVTELERYQGGENPRPRPKRVGRDAEKHPNLGSLLGNNAEKTVGCGRGRGYEAFGDLFLKHQRKTLERGRRGDELEQNRRRDGVGKISESTCALELAGRDDVEKVHLERVLLKHFEPLIRRRTSKKLRRKPLVCFDRNDASAFVEHRKCYLPFTRTDLEESLLGCGRNGFDDALYVKMVGQKALTFRARGKKGRSSLQARRIARTPWLASFGLP